MKNEWLKDFRQDKKDIFDGKTSLVMWLDEVLEKINKDKRESETPKRRKK